MCAPVDIVLCATGAFSGPSVLGSRLPRSNTMIEPSYRPHASKAVSVVVLKSTDITPDSVWYT